VEREASCPAKDYLTGPVVAKILSVSREILDDMVESGVVRPLREPMLNGRKLWGLDDIFRVYLALRLRKEYREKYGGVHEELMLDEVKRDILSVKRVKGPEIRNSKAWTDVVKKAKKRGLAV
jgi:hypothetical protein